MTTFPEISEAVARREWNQLGKLLRRTSTLALAYMGAVIAAFLIFGRFCSASTAAANICRPCR